MAEQVVAEYKIQVDEAVKGLDKLQKEVEELKKGLDDSGKKGKKALDSVGKEASSLMSNMKKLAAVVGVTFAVDRIVSVGKEMVKLASQSEGVERAFKRIGSPQILQGLREATRGTVSDLQLMQNAVKASNFKIPLESLASLFKFAQARARETGESVDYLVDSIILGIGRKSPLILDNLGISAVELRTRLKGVGVEAANVADIAAIIGDIATEELAKMGDQADTTADKLAQLSVIWQNLLVDGGNALINLGTGFAYLLGLLEEIDPVLEGQKKAAKELAAAYGDDLKGAVDDMVKSNQELLESQLKVAELEESRVYQNSREAIQNINDAIEAEKVRQQFLREYIKNLKAIYDASKQVDETEKEEIRNVFFLQNLIKSLKDERSAEGTARERILAINKELIPLEEELAILLGKETDAQKKLREELEKTALIKGQVFTGAEMSEAIPVVLSLLDTLDGLNDELARQNEILNSSPEFSKQYKEAKKAIQELKAEIETFNDDFIDPSKGFLNISTADILPKQSDFNKSIDMFNNYAGQVSNIIGSISQIQANAFAFEQQELERQLEQGIITREEYERKRTELARKQAAAAKDAQLFQATISTAQAIVAALGSVPFTPANIALSALVGAAGAAQIAAIASTPLPQFAKGVIDLKGEGTATSDSIHAKLSRGESVMTAAETKQYNEELWAIRKGNFENLIMTKYVKPMIDESLFKGFADIGRSAELNGITANLKDHNILHGLDRLRQSTVQGDRMIVSELSKLAKRNTRIGW